MKSQNRYTERRHANVNIAPFIKLDASVESEWSDEKLRCEQVIMFTDQSREETNSERRSESSARDTTDADEGSNQSPQYSTCRRKDSSLSSSFQGGLSREKYPSMAWTSDSSEDKTDDITKRLSNGNFGNQASSDGSQQSVRQNRPPKPMAIDTCCSHDSQGSQQKQRAWIGMTIRHQQKIFGILQSRRNRSRRELASILTGSKQTEVGPSLLSVTSTDTDTQENLSRSSRSKGTSVPGDSGSQDVSSLEYTSSNMSELQENFHVSADGRAISQQSANGDETNHIRRNEEQIIAKSATAAIQDGSGSQKLKGEQIVERDYNDTSKGEKIHPDDESDMDGKTQSASVAHTPEIADSSMGEKISRSPLHAQIPRQRMHFSVDYRRYEDIPTDNDRIQFHNEDQTIADWTAKDHVAIFTSLLSERKEDHEVSTPRIHNGIPKNSIPEGEPEFQEPIRRSDGTTLQRMVIHRVAERVSREYLQSVSEESEDSRILSNAWEDISKPTLDQCKIYESGGNLINNPSLSNKHEASEEHDSGADPLLVGGVGSAISIDNDSMSNKDVALSINQQNCSIPDGSDDINQQITKQGNRNFRDSLSAKQVLGDALSSSVECSNSAESQTHYEETDKNAPKLAFFPNETSEERIADMSNCRDISGHDELIVVKNRNAADSTPEVMTRKVDIIKGESETDASDNGHSSLVQKNENIESLPRIYRAEIFREDENETNLLKKNAQIGKPIEDGQALQNTEKDWMLPTNSEQDHVDNFHEGKNVASALSEKMGESQNTQNKVIIQFQLSKNASDVEGSPLDQIKEFHGEEPKPPAAFEHNEREMSLEAYTGASDFVEQKGKYQEHNEESTQAKHAFYENDLSGNNEETETVDSTEVQRRKTKELGFQSNAASIISSILEHHSQGKILETEKEEEALLGKQEHEQHVKQFENELEIGSSNSVSRLILQFEKEKRIEGRKSSDSSKRCREDDSSLRKDDKSVPSEMIKTHETIDNQGLSDQESSKGPSRVANLLEIFEKSEQEAKQRLSSSLKQPRMEVLDGRGETESLEDMQKFEIGLPINIETAPQEKESTVVKQVQEKDSPLSLQKPKMEGKECDSDESQDVESHDRATQGAMLVEISSTITRSFSFEESNHVVKTQALKSEHANSSQDLVDDESFERDFVLSPAETGPSWRMRPEESLSDWTLAVRHIKDGSVDTYHIHKHILAIGPRRSEYMADVFNAEEKTGVKLTTVEMEDLSARLFPVLLDFIYSAELEIHVTTKNAVVLRYLAQFFKVRPLIIRFTEFILEDTQPPID